MGLTRRRFIRQAAAASLLAGGMRGSVLSQDAGVRPVRTGSVRVLNPCDRVPVGIIIDDSTCLVNLNRYAMPQFDEAWEGGNDVYQRDWQAWPVEIPDAFVMRFASWAAGLGVKGKYSVVPYPACVGRLDRLLPGWSRGELEASVRLVRERLMPNWDIHPEMVTHTRVIDLRTGQPYRDSGRRFMENWDWTTGRSAEELTDYLAYALNILKNVGLSCEGVTTPGGFGNQARPQLARAALDSVRGVFGAEIPHYFRDLYDEGDTSVAPRVELASGLEGQDARCVVSLVGCTGDWTGGWDCSEPAGADRFITEDLSGGRLVEVIDRGEPALMVCHWTGIYWNGEERGFRILREVERRLRARFGHRMVWMKLSEVARYWAARELTGIEERAESIRMQAPFMCPGFTLSCAMTAGRRPSLRFGDRAEALREVSAVGDLHSGAWCREGEGRMIVCLDLPKGMSELRLEN